MSKFKFTLLLGLIFGAGLYVHLQSQKQDTMRANFLIIMDRVDAAHFGFEQTFIIEQLLNEAERQRDFTPLHRDNIVSTTKIPPYKKDNDERDLHAILRSLIDYCNTGEITTYTPPHPMALQCESYINTTRKKFNVTLETSINEAIHIADYLETHDEGLDSSKKNHLCDLSAIFIDRNARLNEPPINIITYYFKRCHSSDQTSLFSQEVDKRLTTCANNNAQNDCVKAVIQETDFESLPRKAF